MIDDLLYNLNTTVLTYELKSLKKSYEVQNMTIENKK